MLLSYESGSKPSTKRKSPAYLGTLRICISCIVADFDVHFLMATSLTEKRCRDVCTRYLLKSNRNPSWQSEKVNNFEKLKRLLSFILYLNLTVSSDNATPTTLSIITCEQCNRDIVSSKDGSNSTLTSVPVE